MKSSQVCSLVLLLIACGWNVGCRSQSQVEVIDLNKVLDIYDQVVKSREAPEQMETAELSAEEPNPEDTAAFLKQFAAQLNQAQLIRSPIGVEMLPSGTIRGFVDADQNGVRSSDVSAEPELFTIEFDSENNRIIATQSVAGQQYRRDRRFGPSYVGYYFYYRMHSAMWHRQNRYYGPTRTRPNYGAMQMSSPSYHAAAVSQARSAARRSSRSRYYSRSSARGYSGSRSFSGGK